MALFILIFLLINNCLYSLLGLEENNDKVLEIKSTTITADQNIQFYKVDETLNLTCIFKNESILPNVVLEWIVPSKTYISQNRLIYRRGTNILVLVIENLQENDSGEYKCKAVHNGVPFFNSESSVRIKVKNKKKECTDVMFQCSPGICIPKRYTCDGFRDCLHGEDESPGYCGSGNPCDHKLMCPDNRCIPFTWCCESHKEPNCTTKVKHSCCTHVEKLTRDVDNEIGFQFEQQRFSDMGFLQTTVYTVIGCAMAFMFIVTLIVIAICRVHVRRTLLSRCPAAARNLALGRGANVHGNNLGGWSVRDIELCVYPPNFMSVNPLPVSYNINNGVQFIGRPVDPPPYCEIVRSPPKEGPPPPYASRENLCVLREHDSKSEQDTTEVESTESDALLGASVQAVSVLSSSDSGQAVEEGKNTESEPEFSSESSHCVSNVNISKMNIIVVEGGGLDTTDKVQTGESSSYVRGNVDDISQGAAKKLHSTKSLDSNFRRKGKTVSVNK